MIIGVAPGSLPHGRSNFSDFRGSWEPPLTISHYTSRCRPCFGLETRVDTLEAPSRDLTNWRWTEEPYGNIRITIPSFRHAAEADLSEPHVSNDSHSGCLCSETRSMDEQVFLKENLVVETSTKQIHGFSQDMVSADNEVSYLEKAAGQTRISVECFCLEKRDTEASLDKLIRFLTECRKGKDLVCARHAYFHACRKGLESHPVLGNYLVPMFVDCGCLVEGYQVFERLLEQNEHSWTSLIQGLVECGESQKAFALLERMEFQYVPPSNFTYVAVLKACARERDLERGRELHAKITKQGHEAHLFISNILVDMYSKCRSMGESLHVFYKLPLQDMVSWNALISGYVDNGNSEEALSCVDQMQVKGMSLNELTFISGLKASGSLGALGKGQVLHAELAMEGYEGRFNVGSSLVDMYAKCNALEEAREVLDSLQQRDCISWNPLIVGYAEQGLGSEALDCLETMTLEGVMPDVVTLAGCIKACGTIGATRKAHELHSYCTSYGVEQDSFIGSSLVDMYGKVGLVVEAQEVFNKLTVQGVVPWTALIGGYTDSGLGEEALDRLAQMQVEGVCANDVTLICCLKACGSIGAVQRGRELHMAIAKQGLEKDSSIGSSLVDMYAKCGAPSDAWESLSTLPDRGVIVWTALLAGYAEQGLGEEAFSALKQMHVEGVIPNVVTLICCSKACGSLASISRAYELHADITIDGFESEPLVGTSLVDMYVKCGALEEACEVFDKLPERDVAAWNAVITAYVEHDMCEKVLDCLRQMQVEGLCRDSVTFMLSLKACGTLRALGKGKEIALQLTKEGLDEDGLIGSALIDFYANCGSLVDAQEELEKLPFRDAVSWTALMAGYVEHGFAREALDCMTRMKSEGLLPDAGTYFYCLKACGSLGWIVRGQEIHTEIVIEGFDQEFIIGNLLVDMYARCGRVVEAQDIFDDLQEQDVISWTVLIGGYAENGIGDEALRCFEQMQMVGVWPDVIAWNNLILGYAEQGESAMAYDIYRQMLEQGELPNQVTFMNILKACGNIAALLIGKMVVVHAYGVAGPERIDLIMENAIIDMYGSCGSMTYAQQAFDAMTKRQLVTWNGLITGYARQGESEAVFLLMERMKNEGVRPNEVTFLCALVACNHSGLIDRGMNYFEVMDIEYGLEKSFMHHNCMIDLYGRAGCLDEVMVLLHEMPIQLNSVTWITVLSACQMWGNIELGKHAFESLLNSDERDTATFVIMANIYANANMWDEVKKIEAMQRNLE